MFDDLARLRERTLELGNHHRKYLRYISTRKNNLIELLEQTGAINEVHLFSPAAKPDEEMSVVCQLSSQRDEQLALLGCYFGLQFLRMNIRGIDVLRLDLSAQEDRSRVYRDFMLSMGQKLRRLTGAYMSQLLDLFLPIGQRPEFVICGVGTRADQDDIDLGIVDDGSTKRDLLNRAISRLQREMLRRAIPLHFHISEHVGEQSFSASIAEYTRLLDHEIQDFIIITEMLGALPILGSRELFLQFTQEVTDRYYYSKVNGNRYHEGYLRGMLGEIRSLLLSSSAHKMLHPKRDALRIIKGTVTVQKMMYGIEEVNTWDALAHLMIRCPHHRDVYSTLDQGLSFIEIFRFLYHLLVVQEEGMLLDEPRARARLAPVAELMGYRDEGPVAACDQLLVHYQEHVRRIRDKALLLVHEASKHLERISAFTKVLSRRSENKRSGGGMSGNLAIEFVEALRFYRGTRYWDDVLIPMENDLDVLTAWIAGFDSLSPEARKVWVKRYAKWGEVSALSVMRLVIVLHRYRSHSGAETLKKELSSAFIDRMTSCSDAVQRLSSLYENFPLLINDFLTALEISEVRRFKGILSEPAWSAEVDAQRRKLLHFCRLHCISSHYFKRFLQRVVTRDAAYTKHFHQPERLAVIAKGIIARIDNYTTARQKKEGLGEYYDIEFLRVGLECMAGAPSEKTNAEFTEFSDSYLHMLFEVCKQELHEQGRPNVRTRDSFACYSAGGHGRKLAFDDDYDLLFLLNSDDPDIRRYCTRICTRMNRQIVRRGTMPHFRFAERFGEYVTTFSQLSQLFADPDSQVFIDLSQLMGARKIVGSKKFETDLLDKIIRPFVFDRKQQFIEQVAGEIISRHKAVDDGVISELDVKEAKGGLRDIELLLLILMAKHEIWHPVTFELYEPLIRRMPQHESELGTIFDAFSMLKRLRDVYRLTVAAEDRMLSDEMGYVAQILGYCDRSDSVQGCEQLVAEMRHTMQEVSEIVQRLVNDVSGFERAAHSSE